ncbi:MAG: hypothetical protein JW913_18240 [Chitinispirillaceae bacterium]|nr:hypothetical protein [Chitinispirillaceae bacterium]
MKRSALHKFVRPAFRMQGRCVVVTGLLSLVAFMPTAVQSAADAIDTTLPASVPPEIVADWEAQDEISSGVYAAAIDKIISGLSAKYKSKVAAGTTKEAYIIACHWRRVSRMEYNASKLKRIIFARHYNLGGPTPGYLADLDSDGFKSGIGSWQTSSSKGTNYEKGSALCLLEMKNYYSMPVDLITDTGGVIRDPTVWFDGTRVVFAWSKDNNGYHLYEMPIDSVDKIRQLTKDPEGLTVSDFEPCYLPDSNILFNSTRCLELNSANGSHNSNLFIINKDGKYLRRITYDQFSDFSPSVMEDGKVLYSRWEANDRNIYACFPLMSMNMDGAYQYEFFGNQSTWPGTIFQARRIPETATLLAIISVHHSPYAGELAIINAEVSKAGSRAVKLIVPERAPADTSNIIDGAKPFFQNPFPIDDIDFLVSWRPSAQSPYKEKFNIYFMNVDGERELLAWNSTQSVSQPLLLVKQDPPAGKAYQADYQVTMGRSKLYNTYFGMGVDSTVDSAAYTIRKLRLIALEYPTDPAFGNTGSSEYCMTPAARWPGSRVAKRILGETPVEIDGSAAFYLPARTPVYLQMIDANGCVIQSMRSFFMIQPGERYDCVGCHENKNQGTPPGRLPIADDPRALDPFYDISYDYLSYPKHIQPILDEKCISCHNESHEKGLDLRGDLIQTGTLADPDNKEANRSWCRSYYNLTDPAKNYINYIPGNSPAEGLRPYTFGSSKSVLVAKLRAGHKDVVLSEVQRAKLYAWIDLGIPYGAYTEGMSEELATAYSQRLARRTQHEQLEAQNVAEFEEAGGYPMGVIEPFPGKRVCGASSGCRIALRFFRAIRQLSITVPSEGTLTLIDLHGRRVWSMPVTRETFLKSATLTLPVMVPQGVYIVNFSGRTGSARQLVSML